MTVAVSALWLAFGLYWFTAAIGAKHGSRTRRRWPFVLVALAVFVLLGVVGPRSLVVHSPAVRAVGLVVLVAGLSLAVWARINLGRNWGMPMTKKDEPELVTSGPYAVVRHPIYSGFLLAMLGSALASSISWLSALIVVGAYFLYSARVEQRLMGRGLPGDVPGLSGEDEDADPVPAVRGLSRNRSKAWALRCVGEVLWARAVERLSGATQVPRSPADITAEWLTQVLCPERPGARVIAMRRASASAGTTTRQALEVSYNELGAGLPTRLFVKCTATVAQRLMLGLGGLIEREAGFYNDVRPLLEIEAPVGYFGAVDDRSWRSLVVIEDVVATRDAHFWQPSGTIERAQLEELLRTVAGWHGELWGSQRLEQWTWLKTPAEQMQVIDALLGMANRIPAGVKRAGSAIPPALREADLSEAMRRSMRIASERPHTYLHGDLHIANTYATADGNLGVADWQVGMKGSWAFDYAYLVATALEIEQRRASEQALLDFYLEQLAAAGGGPIARQEAWTAYRQAMFYPYFAWLYTLGRSRLQPRFQPEAVSLMLAERIAVAIDDLDSFAAVGL